MARLCAAILFVCTLICAPVEGEECFEATNTHSCLSVKTGKVLSVGETAEEAKKAASKKEAANPTLVLAQKKSVNLLSCLATWAETMREGDVSRSLLNSFRICGQCNQFARFGEEHDGGYLMCMDGLKDRTVNAVYSMGVLDHDQWSDDVANALHVNVNAFDCTVDSSACVGCKFYRKCIVSADGQHPVLYHEQDGWTLQEALEQTSQAGAPDGSLLMKMDIEGSEWPLYATEHTDALKKFGQIIVEFHSFSSTDKHPEYLKAVKNILDAGFRVVHLHGNNWERMYHYDDLQIPEVLEVTFANGQARPDGCLSDQVLESLDNTNNPNAAELPMAHLAF